MPLPSGSLSIPLRTIKVPGEVGRLAYKLEEIPATGQPRIRGRFALRPEVSMKDFETRAVINWAPVSARGRATSDDLFQMSSLSP